MRGKKDKRANYRRYQPAQIYVGLGEHFCEECKSTLVFAIKERPETCPMCGAVVPPSEVANFKRR